MPKCLSCGKSSIILKLDNITGLCKCCQEREDDRRIEELRASRMMKSGIEEKEKANNATCLDKFMYYYNNAETFLSGVIEIKEKYSGFKYVNEYPNSEYNQLLRDKQWHMRDAIEREYNQIIEDSRGIYKNNKRKSLDSCEYFITSIRKHKKEFDEETTQLTYTMLKKYLYISI